MPGAAGPWRRECPRCGRAWPVTEPIALRECCEACGEPGVLVITIAAPFPPAGSLGELMQEWAAQS